MIQWHDTQVWKSPAWRTHNNNPLITQPFLAYVGHKSHKKFADWLYQYGTTKDNMKYNFMYGLSFPKNLTELALETTRKEYLTKGTVDEKAIALLESMREDLLAQEKTLYHDLGCQNFFEFKAMWDGQKKMENSNDDEKEKLFWLNYHLNLLTGQAQRLATEKGFTLIQQIYAMAEIQLDAIHMEGITEEGEIGKKRLKDELVEAGFLETMWQTYKRTGKEIQIYIPTKKYRKMKQKDFISIIRDYYARKTGQELSDILTHSIKDDLDKTLAWSLTGVEDVMERKSKKRGKTIDASFIHIDFSQVMTNEERAHAAALAFKNLFRKAREVYATNEELKRWELANAGGRMTKYLDKKMEEVCLIYMNQKNPFGIDRNSATYVTDVMGFFGEIAAFAKGHYNLKDQVPDSSTLEIFDIGGLRSKKTNQLLGSDTVIRVNNKNYGIQVKNPYGLKGGYHRTYRMTLGFDSKEKARALQELFGFNDTQMEYFEMYNLNINNTTNPSYFIHQLHKFLAYYSDEFGRLGTEEIQDDLSHIQEPTIRQLEGTSVNNVFFILKGEIFPSSYILEGLIAQYRYLKDDWKNFQRKTSNKNKVLVQHYTNSIKKNLVNPEDERKSYLEVGHKYVGLDIEQFLKKIKITSYLKLEIPSIQDLIDFYDKRW